MYILQEGLRFVKTCNAENIKVLRAIVNSWKSAAKQFVKMYIIFLEDEQQRSLSLLGSRD